jgi:hypothetical protein
MIRAWFQIETLVMENTNRDVKMQIRALELRTGDPTPLASGWPTSVAKCCI